MGYLGGADYSEADDWAVLNGNVTRRGKPLDVLAAENPEMAR